MRTETYSTPGPLLLNLEIPAGEIEIETSNTDETHVELEAISKNDAVRDLVDNSRIELVKRGRRARGRRRGEVATGDLHLAQPGP